MKNLIFLSPYFFPEDFQFNKLYFEIAKKNKIFVITGMPNYRAKKYFKGYSLLGPYKEVLNNLTIIRLPAIPRYGDNIFFIAVFYLSFFILALIFCPIIALVMRNKTQDILTFCGSPVFIGFIGNLMSFCSNCGSSLWIQDIWPEAIISSKKINSSTFNKVINYFQFKMWSNADNIFCQSEQLLNYFKIHFPKKNIKIMYNPSRNILIKKTKNYYQIKKSIDIIYAGNIGLAQNLEPILRGFSELNDKRIKLKICGDGNAKEYLSKKFTTKNILFLGWLNEKELVNLLIESDLALVSLNAIGRQSFILPNKVQTYMQYGIPLLSINSGATNSLVENHFLGISIQTVDNDILCKELKVKLENFMKNKKVYKDNCENFYRKNFTISKVVRQYLNEIL